jgi:hypothetical protein
MQKYICWEFECIYTYLLEITLNLSYICHKIDVYIL